MDEESAISANDLFLKAIANPKIGIVNKVERPAMVKAELQTIYLDDNSQEKIMKTLKYIHGPDFTLTDATAYKQKKSNLTNSYWIGSGNLVVRGGCDNSLNNTDVKKTDEDKFRSYAIIKLEGYGFHNSHCIEALNYNNGDLEKSLLLLYEKYYNIEKKDIAHDHTIDELLEQRKDEKHALESIYGNIFQENISNLIWSLTFKLDYLVQIYTTKNNPVLEKKNVDNRPKCRNFIKGHCKFGEKCRFLHVVEKKPTKDFVDDYTFTLEIRFPKNTSYPFEAPIILLRTNFNCMPKLLRLHICKRLIQEANSLAEHGIVSIYSICELLNNETEIANYLKTTKINFIDESEMLFPPEAKNKIKIQKNLPTHYVKGKTNRDKRSLVSLEKQLKDDKIIAERFIEKNNDSKYKKFIEIRKKLPSWNKKKDILSAVAESQVVVISGETGCGKSTQVPQYILDDWLKNRNTDSHTEIICTQPRRLSAIGVAERVSEERVEKIGDVVGYQIRLETKSSAMTRLTFCTTGILLRRLQSDPQLQSVTHVIVDEVHERSEESDFLILILRDLLPLRPDLKIILMSATMNASLFSNYYGNMPMLEIPGKTYPVVQIFLEEMLDLSDYVIEENSLYSRKVKVTGYNLDEDLETGLIKKFNDMPRDTLKDEQLTISQLISRYRDFSKRTCKNLYLMDPEKVDLDLIESVLMWIVSDKHGYPQEGSILVFLPGISDITSLHEMLLDHREFSPRNGRYVLVPLHSSLSSEEQSLVFKKSSKGVRKIVLSTNIAETSITIDDCVFVIDCGKMKEKRFDSNRNMESLETVWVSKANAMQRKGRAGRVMPGVCVHLFSSNRYRYHFLSQPVPELHRIPLEQLLLKIKVLPNFENETLHGVLERCLEPPTTESIDSAIVRLQDVGALDHEINLTPLGHHLAALPVDVRIGKLMLFGAIFCCVDASLTMAANLSYKSPFIAPFSQKKQADKKRRDFSVANSDQLTDLKAYRKFQEVLSKSTTAAFNFAHENYLSGKTLLTLADIKHQLLELLVSIGFVPADLRVHRRNGQDKVLAFTGPEMNSNGENNRLLAAILCAALYPNVVKVLTPEKLFLMSSTGAIPRQPKPEELKFKTKQDGYVHLHPTSINSTVTNYASPFLVYQEKIKTSRIFVRHTCMVPLLPLALFSGCDLIIERHSDISCLSLEDGWIMFQTETHEIAEMIKTIRLELIKLLEEKIKDPLLNLLHHDTGRRIISTIVDIMSNNY